MQDTVGLVAVDLKRKFVDMFSLMVVASMLIYPGKNYINVLLKIKKTQNCCFKDVRRILMKIDRTWLTYMRKTRPVFCSIKLVRVQYSVIMKLKTSFSFAGADESDICQQNNKWSSTVNNTEFCVRDNDKSRLIEAKDCENVSDNGGWYWCLEGTRNSTNSLCNAFANRQRATMRTTDKDLCNKGDKSSIIFVYLIIIFPSILSEQPVFFWAFSPTVGGLSTVGSGTFKANCVGDWLNCEINCKEFDDNQIEIPSKNPKDHLLILKTLNE